MHIELVSDTIEGVISAVLLFLPLSKTSYIAYTESRENSPFSFKVPFATVIDLNSVQVTAAMKRESRDATTNMSAPEDFVMIDSSASDRRLAAFTDTIDISAPVEENEDSIPSAPPVTLGNHEQKVEAEQQEVDRYSAPLLDGVQLSQTENNETSAHGFGAGMVGGLIGFLVGGPIIATIAGFATAWASKKDGAAGDMARAMGDVALTARDKAIEVNEKHLIIQGSKNAASDAVQKIKEIDRKHEVVAKTKEFAGWSWDTIKVFNQKHRVVDRALITVCNTINWVVAQISVHDNESNRTQEITSADNDPNHNVNSIEVKPIHGRTDASEKS